MTQRMQRVVAGTSRVAVVGLGSMGYGIAGSLLRGGFDVAGYDIAPAVLERFAGEGGRAAHSPAEASEGVEAVVCVVLNAAQTETILFGEAGCAEAMPAGAVFVSCATMSPDAARDLAGRVEAAGRHYIDAPISGGSQRAAEGALTVLASGSAAAFERASRLLDVMAATVYNVGDTPGLGAAFKMVNQLLAGVHIAAACEAIAFAAKQGLDLARVYEVISASAGSSWMFENRVPHVLQGDYRPRSAIDIFTKDLGIVLDMARAEKFPVPMAGAALQLFLMAAAAGMGRDDDASVARVFARIASLDLPGLPGPGS